MSDLAEKVEKAMRNWARTDDELADMTADIVRLVAGVAAERDRLREALEQIEALASVETAFSGIDDIVRAALAKEAGQ